jgi:two-component system, NtrC family, sensor kinase
MLLLSINNSVTNTFVKYLLGPRSRFVCLTRGVLLSLCVAATAFAQKPIKPIEFEDLSRDGIALHYHWYWRAGDQPNWRSSTAKDTTGWFYLNSISFGLFNENLELLRQAQISWYKRGFRVSADLVNRPLHFEVKQVGASEIYVDGKLIGQIGKVSANPRHEQTKVNGRLLSFTLPDTNLHTLSVRFSCDPTTLYQLGSTNLVFHIRLFDSISRGDTINVDTNADDFLYPIVAGMFLIFCILHFLFFRANRERKTSLYLGLTTFFLATSLFFSIFDNNENNVFYYQLYGFLQIQILCLAMLGLLTSLYQHVHQSFGIFFWVTTGLTAVAMIASLIGYALPADLQLWPSFLLLFIDFVRVSIIAETRGEANAKLPLYSLIVSAAAFIILVIFGVFLNSYATKSFAIPLSLEFLLVTISFLILFGIPLGMSLSLVVDYSRTTQRLRNKIQEIEYLSLEKQQILASQNELLEKQVEARTAELRASQAQLIQSEKLASLGELTAGIAHEIQNPLNFVNNFSELSVELIAEIKQEREVRSDERDEGLIDELLGDLSQNQQKINHHGKRASSIVKGMLEHSRMSTGVKELTDIKKLADEYLRLSYHGMRAKDKSFDADYELIADENLPLVNVVPQDMGRVLLNLINNAFYAVSERHSKSQRFGMSDYQPKVSVRSKVTGNQVEISVADNGNGIPASIKAKIFQPFFTTKPTGEGTGLGLSLSYDIITKGHGGMIEVESVEGEGTTFVVKLLI